MLPTYPPTWVDSPTELDVHAGWRHYIVYDESEGFQPAYALVMADNSGDAIDVATEISDGRLVDSESLAVRVVEPDPAIVRRVQAELNGKEWSPDTLNTIAHILRANGYEVSDTKVPS